MPPTAVQRAIVWAALITVLASGAESAFADPFTDTEWVKQPLISSEQVAPTPNRDDQPANAGELPARLQRQVVDYATAEKPGTIIVDTPDAYLYFMLGGGKAIRYGIGIGREGFTWSGIETIARKAEWPDWYPPADMLQRQPYLPRFMAGGPSNPLGARALYLGHTMYRIHGTNKPETIGRRVSSGCIRLLNEDVIDLYSRVQIGTKVVVLPASETRRATVSHATAPTLSTRATSLNAFDLH